VLGATSLTGGECHAGSAGALKCFTPSNTGSLTQRYVKRHRPDESIRVYDGAI
jgi:hypothetical protein